MDVLSWGKPKIEIGLLGADGDMSKITDWIRVDTPVDGSTQLNTSEGEKQEAVEEGGAIVATKYKKSTYSLQFQLFKKAGVALPVEDKDGIVAGLYALRLQPEDPEVEGLVMPKVKLRANTTYSSADGIRVTYTADALVSEGDVEQMSIEVVTLSTDNKA